MGKKKTAVKKTAKKKAGKKATHKKTAAKKTRSTKTPVKKLPTAKKKTATKKKAGAKAKHRKAKGAAKSLGRPRVAGDANLDQFFTRDYEVREVFAFLRVATLKELEAFGPEEIVEKLTAPVIRTVDRIRKALAINNRCLKNDHAFAMAFQKALGTRS